jgi:hypothetical protein
MHPAQFLEKQRISKERKQELIVEGRVTQQKLIETKKRLAELEAAKKGVYSPRGGGIELEKEGPSTAFIELEATVARLKSEVTECVAEIDDLDNGAAPRPKQTKEELSISRQIFTKSLLRHLGELSLEFSDLQLDAIKQFGAAYKEEGAATHSLLGGGMSRQASFADVFGSNLFGSDLFGLGGSPSNLHALHEDDDHTHAVSPLEVSIERFFEDAMSGVTYYEIHFTGEVSGTINQRYNEFKKLRDALRLQNPSAFADATFGMSTMSSEPAERQPLLQDLLAAMINASSKVNDRRLIEDFLAMDARSSMRVSDLGDLGR